MAQGEENQEIKEAEKRVINDIRQLIAKLSEADDPEYRWFTQLLSAILRCVLTDYKKVESSATISHTQTAWARRNLLELKIITHYILSSERNAQAFRVEVLIDNKEFYESVSKYMKISHEQLIAGMKEVSATMPDPIKDAFELKIQQEIEQGAPTATTDAAAAEFKAMLTDLGQENTKLKHLSEMATTPELKEEFAAMNKICSKLTHRTAFSIALIPSSDLTELIDQFVTSGFTDLMIIFGAVKTHFEKHGGRPV